MKSAAVRPAESQAPMLAGRKWLRAYVNGCAFQFLEVGGGGGGGVGCGRGEGAGRQ